MILLDCYSSLDLGTLPLGLGKHKFTGRGAGRSFLDSDNSDSQDCREFRVWEALTEQSDTSVPSSPAQMTDVRLAPSFPRRSSPGSSLFHKTSRRFLAAKVREWTSGSFSVLDDSED